MVMTGTEAVRLSGTAGKPAGVFAVAPDVPTRFMSVKPAKRSAL
jgi:hypothetical protein